jgi:hypothetical protein
MVIVPWFSIFAPRPGRLIEHHLSGHEVAVADACRRNHQPGGVDLSAVLEHQSSLVDDHHYAVRDDMPGDVRRVGTDDPVQRHRPG